MAMFSQLVDSVVSHPFVAFAAAVLLFVLGVRIYRVFLHPLSSFPGPWYRAAFYFPFHWEQIRGVSPYNVDELHRKYGPVVRIAPETLSFVRSKAWKDIYGFQKDRRQIPKDYKRFIDVPDYLPLFGDNDHARMRKLVAHAFSETALREQEPLVQDHIAELVDQIKSRTDSNTASIIDLNHWLDLLSFDIVSDLTFGEPFEGIKTGVTHDHIKKIYLGCKMTPALLMSWDYEIVKWAFKLMSYLPSIRYAQEGDRILVDAKIERRKALKDDLRKDFMTYILRHNDERGVNDAEMRGLTTVFMAAGGEKPSSLLSTLLFYLLTNPKWMNNVQTEVRSSFDAMEDIKIKNLSQMTYLNAVIQETLRIRPPSSGHFTRRTTRQEFIDSYYVPPNTSVEVSAYAACHDPNNWVEPEAFAPERWLPDASDKYNKEDKAVLQPFSTGPRSCIGKNLAYLVIRSTLAHLLWSFDMELSEESRNWIDSQKFMTVWHRSPLNVLVTQRK